MSFASAIAQAPLYGLFHLPLSSQAHSQLLQLHESLEGRNENQEHDKWSYIWNREIFSVNRAYKHLSGHQSLHPVYKWLWSSCQNKHRVFFWLLIKDRLSTRELLRRKNMQLEDHNCTLCNGSIEEASVHLFLLCPFAEQCWSWLRVQVDQNLGPFQNLKKFKEQLSMPFFMEIIVLMCWTIWKARNDLIFRQEIPSLQASKDFFRKEFSLLLLRAKKSYSPLIDQWFGSLV